MEQRRRWRRRQQQRQEPRGQTEKRHVSAIRKVHVKGARISKRREEVRQSIHRLDDWRPATQAARKRGSKGVDERSRGAREDCRDLGSREKRGRRGERVRVVHPQSRCKSASESTISQEQSVLVCKNAGKARLRALPRILSHTRKAVRRVTCVSCVIACVMQLKHMLSVYPLSRAAAAAGAAVTVPPELCGPGGK